MGHRNNHGVLPSFFKKRRAAASNNVTFDVDLTENEENQELIQYYGNILEAAKTRAVSYPIAQNVGEYFDVYECDWKWYASGLGIAKDRVLRKIKRSAEREKQFPFTQLLLCEDFKQKTNLGSLLQMLLKEKQYCLLREIRPLIEEHLQREEEDSCDESGATNASRNAITFEENGNICININSATVSINGGGSVLSNCSINTEAKDCSTKSENRLDIDIPKHEETQQSRMDPTVTTSCISESFATKVCASSIFSTDTASSRVFTSTPSFLSNSECPTSIRDIFDSLPSSKPIAIPPNKTLDVKLCRSPIPIYVFVTHTLRDKGIAEIVANRLRDDFNDDQVNFITATQFQLQHIFHISHELTVSRILNEIHFVMPVISPSYMQEIEVPEDLEDCPTRHLAVRNIFTALQADFFRRASLNWKIRPVVVEGARADLARRKQELRCAMRLWDDWELVGPMLRDTVLHLLPQYL